MKLRWTRPALADLVEAQNFIARDNPSAAENMAQRIWEAAKMLCDHPEIGRRGQLAGTRDTVQILRVWHGRRNWQANPTG